MKTKLLVILLITISLFFIACSEDSVTEAVIGTSTLTLSDDMDASFKTVAIASISNNDSTSTFEIEISPAVGETAPDGILAFGNNSGSILPVGTYPITYDSESSTGTYSIYIGVDDIYLMNNGELKITASSATSISGTYDVSGNPWDFISVDSSRTLNAKGSFTAIIMQ